MSGVPGRAGVGRGCRFQEGVNGAFPGVFPAKVVLRNPLVVVPFLLPPPLEGRVVRWELSLNGLVVLFGFFSLVFRVLVCGGCGEYGLGLHGVVGFPQFHGLLVGVWARCRGCQ